MTKLKTMTERELLEAALAGLQFQRSQLILRMRLLESQIHKDVRRGPKSPEARARISAAQHRRWAKWRREQRAQRKVA